MEVRTIILVESYLPGSASTNRMLCYAKGYQSLGINTIFLLQCNEEVVLPNIEGVTVVKVPESNSKSRLVQIVVRVKKMIQTIKQFYRKSETVVHVWNVPLFIWFINKKKYSIFCEIGEIPNYAETGSFSYKVKEKLRLYGPRAVKGIIVQTNALMDYFLEHGVTNIVQSNVFVDTNRFDNLHKTSTAGDYIAYCGTISKHKDGVDDLLKAFKIVHERYDNYKLYIIGGYTSAYNDKKELDELVFQLGLNESVCFTGKVLPDDIPQLLYDASILALARPDNIQAKYGFPTKVGEYLCTGNPSVLTNVGELPSFLEDKKNCVFSKPNDYKDFADKLIWVIENSELADKIAKEGKELVYGAFSIERQCKKVVSFFRNIE